MPDVADTGKGAVVNGEDRNDTLLSLLAGVGIGALVGAAAALLLAPQSGEETRTQIRGTADDVLVKLRDTVEDMRGKVDEMVASLKSRGVGSGAGDNLETGGGEASATGV
jgi:gas vesicle protein